MQESHVFHLLFRIIDCIIYSIRKKGKGASPAHGVAPSFFPSQGRTLPQSEEAKENPRESLSFLPSAPVKKGCLSASCWDVSSYTSDATHSRRSAEGTAR